MPTHATTDTLSLSGLRTVFNIAVVTLHTIVFASLSLDNPNNNRAFITGGITANILGFVTTLGNASVDIFLLISGFLLKSSLPRVAPYTALRYTVFRYLRFAPVYLTIAFALRSVGRQECIGWSEALLLSYKKPAQHCIGVWWSTSVDFISHILLLPLLSSPSILYFIILLTPPLRLWTWLQRGRPFSPSPQSLIDFMSNDEETNKFSQQLGIPRGNWSNTDPTVILRRELISAYTPLYFGVASRIAAVAIGVLLYSCIRNKNLVYRTVRRLPNLALACTAVVWACYHALEQRLFTEPWAQLIHHSAGRVLVSLATSVIIILTCTIEDRPLPNRIPRLLRATLSCRLVLLLSRFSYLVYLLHTVTAPALAFVPPRMTPDRLVPGWMLLLGVKWYLFTILVGLPVWGVEWLALRGRQWLRLKVSGSGKNSIDLAKKAV